MGIYSAIEIYTISPSCFQYFVEALSSYTPAAHRGFHVLHEALAVAPEVFCGLCGVSALTVYTTR